jgi:hypothetical protein
MADKVFYGELMSLDGVTATATSASQAAAERWST